jgi:competence protein ComEA
MEPDELTAKLVPFAMKYWLPLLLALFGLIFFIYGLISLFSSSQKSEDLQFQTGSSTSDHSTSSANNSIVVDVEGEVVQPGVYRLKDSSIVQDALVAGGGMTAFADREWVAKNLNLALKLTDGQKVYIPKQNELDNSQSSNVLAQTIEGEAQTSLLNVNSASAEALDSLYGVGQATAKKIIDNRPYTTINNLIEKKILSQKVFDQIKDKIVAQ